MLAVLFGSNYNCEPQLGPRLSLLELEGGEVRFVHWPAAYAQKPQHGQLVVVDRRQRQRRRGCLAPGPWGDSARSCAVLVGGLGMIPAETTLETATDVELMAMTMM